MTMTRETSRRLAEAARKKAAVSREDMLMSRLAPPKALQSAVPDPTPVLLVDSMPQELMTEWGTKLYMLMNLAWGYVETILDICIQQRIPDTKPLVRRIRDIRRRYDQFRHRSIDDRHDRMETYNAEVFESNFSADFDRLFHGLELEAGRHRLTDAHRTLLIATHQALTIMDAVKMYARMCDREIRDRGIWTCDLCLLQSEFQELYPLIPQFAGDCYRGDVEARRLTAGILVNRINAIKLTETDK